jgi:hypothetical protein
MPSKSHATIPLKIAIVNFFWRQIAGSGSATLHQPDDDADTREELDQGARTGVRVLATPAVRYGTSSVVDPNSFFSDSDSDPQIFFSDSDSDSDTDSDS